MGTISMCRVTAALVGLTFAVSAAASAPGLNLGGISAIAGGKLLNKDDWSPAEQHFEGGVRLAFQPSSWPIGFTAAYFSSYGRGNDGSGVGEFRARTRELQLGLEKIWAVGSNGRPFVDGGVVLGKAAATLSTVADSDTGVGGWAGGGYTWVLAGHLGLGVDASYSYVPVTPFGAKVNGGGFHIGGTIGYQW